MTIRKYETLGTVCTASRVRPEKSGQLSITIKSHIMQNHTFTFDEYHSLINEFFVEGEASDTAFQLVKDALKSGKYIKKCSHRAMINGKEERVSAEYNGLGDE